MSQDTLSYMHEGTETRELQGAPSHEPQPGASGGPLPLTFMRSARNSSIELSLISVL